MKTTIVSIDPPRDGRLIAISDIHGYVHYLKGLLEKLQFGKKDVLILVGDLIEKGPKSLETVRFILDQKEKGAKIYTVMGNVEQDRIGAFFEEKEDSARRFLQMLSFQYARWKRGFFPDILQEMGFDAAALCADWQAGRLDETEAVALKAQIQRRFGRELSFLQTLPTVLSCGSFLFVHAGVPTDSLSLLAETDAASCLKRDAFLQEDVRFDKYVVVGHWPVCLYGEQTVSVSPIYEKEKHIVCLDGGCALKTGAQLNALVLSPGARDMSSASFVSYDDYPVRYAKKAQGYKAPTIHIRFDDCQVEILEEKGDMAYLLHPGSGREFWAPRSFLFHKNGKAACDDYADTFLSVQEGDALSVIEETDFGWMVKKDGEIGWYRP